MTNQTAFTAPAAIEYAQYLAASLNYPIAVTFGGLAVDGEVTDNGDFKAFFTVEETSIVIDSKEDWGGIILAHYEEINVVTVQEYADDFGYF